ncbi:MAG: hypothetical protein WCP69_08345 [Bacteroidota bacterium]
MKRFCIVQFLIFSLITIGNSQSEFIDYRTVFPESFSNATYYLTQNKWMVDTLKKRGVDPFISLSVVFPELIRFNQMQDNIEVTALNTLYIQYGSSYSNFSIGRFQMKPSFAEDIEAEWNCLTPKPECFKSVIFDSTQTRNNRRMRIQRLDNQVGQLFYLSLFYFIVERKFSINLKTDLEKVHFYATAYNYGFRRDFEKIKAHILMKEFHTDIFKTKFTTCYSYADISSFFYQYFKKTETIKTP